MVFEQDRELRYTWIHNPALADQLHPLLGKRDRDVFERLADAAVTEALKRGSSPAGRDAVATWWSR